MQIDTDLFAFLLGIFFVKWWEGNRASRSREIDVTDTFIVKMTLKVYYNLQLCWRTTTDQPMTDIAWRAHTADVESDVVGVAVVFGADLTAVETLVRRPHVLYDKTPLSRPLVVVDADACVRSELEQTDRQRMNLVAFPPRHLSQSSSSASALASSFIHRKCNYLINS